MSVCYDVISKIANINIVMKSLCQQLVILPLFQMGWEVTGLCTLESGVHYNSWAQVDQTSQWSKNFDPWLFLQPMLRVMYYYICNLFWNFGILDFFDFLIWIPNVYVNCQQKNACYFFPEHMYIISYCITYQANTLIDC